MTMIQEQNAIHTLQSLKYHNVLDQRRISVSEWFCLNQHLNEFSSCRDYKLQQMTLNFVFLICKNHHQQQTAFPCYQSTVYTVRW